MKRIPAVFMSLHFFFLLLVVSHLYDWIETRPSLVPVNALADYYSSVTFANRNFGFFAPEVTGDWNARFILTDRNNRKRERSLRLPNREMKVKMYSMIGHFGESDDNMDLFARSWALKFVNENPDVTRVDVIITQNRIPSMAEYRQGRRIEPEPYYRTTFELM